MVLGTVLGKRKTSEMDLFLHDIVKDGLHEEELISKCCQLDNRGYFQPMRTVTGEKNLMHLVCLRRSTRLLETILKVCPQRVLQTLMAKKDKCHMTPLEYLTAIESNCCGTRSSKDMHNFLNLLLNNLNFKLEKSQKEQVLISLGNSSPRIFLMFAKMDKDTINPNLEIAPGVLLLEHIWQSFPLDLLADTLRLFKLSKYKARKPCQYLLNLGLSRVQWSQPHRRDVDLFRSLCKAMQADKINLYECETECSQGLNFMKFAQALVRDAEFCQAEHFWIKMFKVFDSLFVEFHDQFTSKLSSKVHQVFYRDLLVTMNMDIIYMYLNRFNDFKAESFTILMDRSDDTGKEVWKFVVDFHFSSLAELPQEHLERITMKLLLLQEAERAKKVISHIRGFSDSFFYSTLEICLHEGYNECIVALFDRGSTLTKDSKLRKPLLNSMMNAEAAFNIANLIIDLRQKGPVDQGLVNSVLLTLSDFMPLEPQRFESIVTEHFYKDICENPALKCSMRMKEAQMLSCNREMIQFKKRMRKTVASPQYSQIMKRVSSLRGSMPEIRANSHHPIFDEIERDAKFKSGILIANPEIEMIRIIRQCESRYQKMIVLFTTRCEKAIVHHFEDSNLIIELLKY